MRKLVFVYIIATSTSIASQNTWNQFDNQGKKDGKWIVYLDENWRRTDDSSKAYFKRFTQYSHGTNIYPMGPCGKTRWKLEGKRDNGITLLNGEYTWYNSHGKLISKHVFNEGKYEHCFEYYSNGNIEQHFNYTETHPEQNSCWTVTKYKKNGMMKIVIPFFIGQYEIRKCTEQ